MLTQEDVHHLFNYDEKTGNLVWKSKISKKVAVGNIAGSLRKDGYRIIQIYKKRYYVHRLIFLFHHGYFPENDIDHRKGNPENNKIENLREVSRSCNMKNSGLRKDNKSGVKGVSWNKTYNKWAVRIRNGDSHSYIGRFDCFDEAVCHRLAAEQCLDWNGCSNNSSAYKYVRKNIQGRKRRRSDVNIS